MGIFERESDGGCESGINLSKFERYIDH